MSCSVHWLQECVNFTVNTNPGLFWVSLIPDLVCSKIFSYYSIFSYDCNAIYCIFLVKEKRDMNFVQSLLNCHSNSGTLTNGNISYQLKDSQDTMESWPILPLLSENYDVSSIHIHKTFNTVFLTRSFVSLLPPPSSPVHVSTLTRFTVLCVLYTRLKAKWYSQAQERGADIAGTASREGTSSSLSALWGFPRGRWLSRTNSFSMESFFLHGGPPFGKALPLYCRWASLGFTAVVLRDLGYMWKPSETPQAWEGGRETSPESFCGWAGTNHMGCDSYRHTLCRETTGCPSPHSRFPVSSLLPPHQMATTLIKDLGAWDDMVVLSDLLLSIPLCFPSTFFICTLLYTYLSPFLLPVYRTAQLPQITGFSQNLWFRSHTWWQNDFKSRKDILCCLSYEFSRVFTIWGGVGE